MNPRVSIIVPSYNHGRFLRQCIQRVIDQTFSNWELILVDDGSKDDSVAIARSYTDPRIRVYENEVNLGTYGTEQKALGLANGELVAVLNSDDLWAEQKLERQVELLDRHPDAVLCYCLGWKVNDEGVVDTDEDVHADWPRDEVQDVLPYLMYENRILASGVLFRRTKLRFETSCRYSGDWLALLDQARSGPVACVTERVTFWRMHDNNSYVVSPKVLAEEIRVRRAIESEGKNWAGSPSQLAAVKWGLGKNSINLVPLSLFFMDRKSAFLAGINAIILSTDKTSAVKRTLCTLLPMNRVRGHFWNDEFLSKVDLPPEELRRMVLNLPPLSLAAR
jgi:glycosyltransferase involved in cell wall biosynthesis